MRLVSSESFIHGDYGTEGPMASQCIRRRIGDGFPCPIPLERRPSLVISNICDILQLMKLERSENMYQNGKRYVRISIKVGCQ